MDLSPETTVRPLKSGLFENSIDEDALMLPRSELDSLSDLQVQQVQTDLGTELFGFSPITFTSRVVDIANEVIYDVIDKIEVECMRRWVGDATDSPADETRKQAVEKGVNRLETLLMAAVDLRFDQAEVWLLRNTFQVPRDLIPYVLLPHHPQEGFAPYLNNGEDEALMKELEVQITRVSSQREEIAILDLVHERQLRRVEALKQIKSNLSQLLTSGGARDTLSSSSKALALEVPSFVTECRRLLSTSVDSGGLPATSTSLDTSEQPWGQSREAYLAWRVDHSKQNDSLAQDATHHHDDMLGITRFLGAQGTAEDAAALKHLLDV